MRSTNENRESPHGQSVSSAGSGPQDNRIVLHVCCAPCAAPCAERLIVAGYAPLLCFSNSNLHPEEEYRKRLEEVKTLADQMSLPLKEDPYDHSAWLARVRGLEKEPERGPRCRICFEFRLEQSRQAAVQLGIPYFTTTLTLSPQKVSRIVFEAAESFAEFKPFDFKKKGGFLRSTELSRKYGFYRQNYCGCEFSVR